jgi:uncharacterized protein (TIGR02679 family)
VTEPSKLRALLGGPGLALLFETVRRRLEETGGAARTVTVRDAPAETRSAIADLMGWSAVPEDPVRVDLAALDRVLRDSAAGVGLRGALEALSGPLRDLRGERRARDAERERLWDDARAALAAVGRADLYPWLEQLRRGALVRAAGAARRAPGALLPDALRVALRLPAGGKLLPVLASELLGDPHALDAGAPLGAIVLRAAAVLAGWPEVPSTAALRRRLWAEVGVDCDPLSANVLVLGLRPGGTGLLARHLREAADAGQPRRLTLRELVGSDLAFAGGATLHVCENPAVLAAAADALGARTAPVVCAEGVPSTAVIELLRRSVADGAALRVRADLDWAGLRIAGQVMALGNAAPWRFSARDYEAAIAAGRIGPPLQGPPAAARWDPALPDAMLRAGASVPEERLLDALLADLGGGR